MKVYWLNYVGTYTHIFQHVIKPVYLIGNFLSFVIYSYLSVSFIDIIGFMIIFAANFNSINLHVMLVFVDSICSLCCSCCCCCFDIMYSCWYFIFSFHKHRDIQILLSFMIIIIKLQKS